jgi:hypothetical protein
MDRLGLHRLLPISQYPDDRLYDPACPAMLSCDASIVAP